MNSTKAELNSWKAAVSNEVRVYQSFCDRNLTLKKRENEFWQTIDELEAKKAELQKPKLNEPLLEFHESNGNKDVSLEVQQEDGVIWIHHTPPHGDSWSILGPHESCNIVGCYCFKD